METVAESAAIVAGQSSVAPTVDVQPSSTPTQNALEYWKSFNLNERRAQLDKQGLAIADRQEASTASRKQLSTNTKNFRRSVADGAPISAKDVGNILRAYQTEIDSLTSRAKAAETSFISLYKALYDAPDPADVLSDTVRDTHTLQQLREQVATLKEERAELLNRTSATSSLEQRVRDLEAQLSKVNQRAEEDARQMLEEKQNQWMAAQQKAIEAYELREQELIHQLRLENDSSRRKQATCDEMQQQLNDARSQVEHMKSTRASVDAMAVEDLERTRAEANSLRRRCKQLENRVAGLPEDADTDTADAVSAVGPSAIEVAARDVQISQLKDQVSALEEVLGGKDLEKRNEFAKLTALITEKDSELASVRSKLERLPTVDEYESMKRQFEALQSFQLLDAESSSMTDNADADDSVDGRNEPTARMDNLETRLLNKVKVLEGRLTKLRVDLSDKDDKINELRTSLRSYEDQVTDQKVLIGKLEDGINAITGDTGGMQSLKRRAVAASIGDAEDNFKLSENPVENNEEGQSAWDWGEKHQAEGLENIIQREPSMLDIVAGQRDRFRSRTLELEDDNRKLMERIEKVVGDMDSLKNDNVKLYEKLRFVQSYRQSNGALGTTAPATSTSIDIGAPNVEEEDGGGLLGKYRSLYEDMVNPYTIFNRRERHKRISEMSAPERFTLRAGQRALSTRTSRLVVFFYIISLHVFVALVLAFSNTVCESDSVTTKATHST